MNPRTYFHTTGIIFLLITVLHLLRLVFAWEAQIGGVVVPMWLSVIAIIIAAYLSYQSFRMEKRNSQILVN